MMLLGGFSVVVAALQFVVPLYMMAVYNRILQTKSIETLQIISLIAVVLLVLLGIVEIGRSRLLALISTKIANELNNDVYQAILAAPGSELHQKIAPDPTAPRAQALQDLRTVTQFISTGALNTFFDALLAPIFLVALFILHPNIGWIGVIAGGIIFSLAFISELLARRADKDISKLEGQAAASLERSLSQYDAVMTMGLGPRLYDRWNVDRQKGSILTRRTQTTIGVLSGMAKAVRLVVQMGVLGVGGWLVITTDVFLAGAIIAASIILGRALAPIDQSISLWRPFVTARQSSDRLVKVLNATRSTPPRTDVPAPKAVLNIEAATIGFPNQARAIMQNATFRLEPGQSLGVFGANGLGKTTLLRVMLGALPALRGGVTLGATPVRSYSDTDRAAYFGYLPQDTQLLPGTVAENIARFTEPDKNQLFDAVEAAGAMEFIQNLPLGFATPVEAGLLSAGQMQMIGLARAVYGAPVLLGLDEPTANLDAQGRTAVLNLLKSRSQAGLITVFVSHDDGLLKTATHLLQMAPRGMRGLFRFGETAKVLEAIKEDQTANQPPQQGEKS